MMSIIILFNLHNAHISQYLQRFNTWRICEYREFDHLNKRVMQTISIKEFHHADHKEWMSTLDFYQDEIKIFQSNLSKVVQAHSDLFSIIEMVDEYRKLLMKKLFKIDELRHQIALHEHHISNPLADQKSEFIWDHQEVNQRMKDLKLNFNGLKKNLRRFTAKYI